jgi:hypothetical protein
MALRLHRCSWLWAKAPGHACWRVQKALNEQDIPYETVVHSNWDKFRRRELVRLSGQKRLPVIEFENGGVYREESKAMAGRFARGGSRKSAKRSLGPAKLSPPGAIAQLGERVDRTHEVAGSSPASSIKEKARKSGLFLFLSGVARPALVRI